MNSNFFEIKENLTLRQFILKFEQSIKENKIFTAIKFNKKKQIIGVITRGDLRRLIYNNSNPEINVDRYLNRSPIIVKNSQLDNNLFSIIKKKIKEKTVDDIIVIDKKKKFLGLIKLDEIKNNFYYKKTCVIGLGHIGLPLSIFLLKKFLNVVGYDNNLKKLKKIKKNKLDFYEKNLDELLSNHIKSKTLKLTNNLKETNGDVFIICVGSTISKQKVNNVNLKKLATQLSKVLKKGDLIILRGTVSIGATRKIFLSTLLKHTNLKNGIDFYLAYMPERLIEGDALEELNKIPQLVSGSTDKCLEQAYNYSKEIFDNVIKLKSLEEGEIIKLASNSFRALNFAFSNEISRISNIYGLSGSELIKKANYGYERNSISKPSLGIGGFCLPKDPILFANNFKNNSNYQFGKLSSKVNNDITNFFTNKFLKILKTKANPTTLVMGLAFKGIPETLDTRNSTAIKIIKKLCSKNYKCHSYDPLGKLIKDKIHIKNLLILNKRFDINKYDLVIVVNDHPKFVDIVNNNLRKNNSNQKKYIFDTWNNFNKTYVKSLNWEYLNI